MKIENNITLYAGAQPGNSAAAEGTNEEQENRKTLFAGNLNQGNTLQDRIAEKKAQAQQKAMKVVGEVFAADRALDEDMNARRQHVKDLSEERKVLQDEMAGIMERQETLEKARENGEIGEEQYAQEMENLREEQRIQDQKLNENQGTMESENATIRNTRIERLKHHAMTDAQAQAEDIMAAARDEIIGMVKEEGIDHADEEADKREEQAEAVKEEKEEKEQLLEKQKEKREEQETWLEEMGPAEFSELVKTDTDVQKEVQDMLKKMNLLDEDLKGAAVDQSI